MKNCTKSAIEKELKRARKKFPSHPVEYLDRAAIMVEEAGETIQAALKFKYENGSEKDIQKEAIHTAAMAIRLLEGF